MEGKKELIEKVKAQLRELEPHLEKFQGKARIAKAETAVKYEKSCWSSARRRAASKKG